MRWSSACTSVLLLVACGRARFDDRPDAATDYASIVRADHPLAYWRLDGDEPGRDDLGADDGQVTGTCALGAPGALSDGNTALSFDGASCKVMVSSGYDFLGTAAFSIEAWVAVGSGGAQFRNVFGQQSRDTQNPIDGYALVIAPGGISVERAIAMVNVKTNSVPLATDVFAYVVATYDGATIRIYVDGTLRTSMADARPMPAYTATGIIGASERGNYFPGRIDELAVYDTALDADTIARHHAAATAN